MTSPSTTKYLRTSIVLSGADAVIDVQLPAESPVDDVVYDLIRYLHDELTSQGRATEWLLEDDAVWTLERFGRRQLDGALSLSEQHVHDGERIYLTKDAGNETYPALIDDIAESVAKHQEFFPEWKYDVDAIRFSAYTIRIVGMLLVLGAAYLVSWGFETDNGYRWPVLGAIAAVTVLSTALSIPILRGGDRLLGTSLLCISYAGVASTMFSAIPRHPGLWHIAATAAALLVFSAIITPLTPGPTRLHSGVVAGTLPIAIISVVNYFYTSDPYIIGAQVAMLGFIIILMSSRVAMAAAKVETPYVPAAGEALNKDETTLGSVSRKSSSREVIESVINQKEQSQAAHEYLFGILAGASSTIVASALVSGLFVDSRQWLLFGFYVSVSMCLMYRARNDINRDVHTLLLIAGLATMSAYTVGIVASNPYGNIWQIVAATAAIAAASLVGSLWALSQKIIKAPTVRRYFELVEFAMYAAPALWLGFLMDVYMKARNR